MPPFSLVRSWALEFERRPQRIAVMMRGGAPLPWSIFVGSAITVKPPRKGPEYPARPNDKNVRYPRRTKSFSNAQSPAASVEIGGEGEWMILPASARTPRLLASPAWRVLFSGELPNVHFTRIRMGVKEFGAKATQPSGPAKPIKGSSLIRCRHS